MFGVSKETKEHLLNLQNIPVIYGIKNLINNKIYIGKSINVNIRKKQHENAFNRKDGVNTHLQHSIDKYGIVNFEFLIIEEVSLDTIDEREQYGIQNFQSFNPLVGYNKTMGGDGGNLTEETKIKISITSPNRKTIYQFSENGELIKIGNGVRDVERELGFLSSTISKACKKSSNKSAYNYYGSYENYLTDLPGIGQDKSKIKVQQFSLIGELITTGDSISLAAKETKSSKSSIIRCCKNRQKTCNGFIGKYLDN